MSDVSDRKHTRRVVSTFCGTSDLHIGDDQHSLMTTPFFSRVSILRAALRKISPDPRLIEAGLRAAKITTVDAIFVSHSHHDHVMDAALTAKKCGSQLYGSSSALNVGSGGGLSRPKLHPIEPNMVISVGDFRIAVRQSDSATPASCGIIAAPPQRPI